MERALQGGSRQRSLEQLQADVGWGWGGVLIQTPRRTGCPRRPTPVSGRGYWLLAGGSAGQWSVFTCDRPSTAVPGTLTSSWCLASHSGHPKMTRWEHHSFGSPIAALLSYPAGPSSREPAQVQEEMAQTPSLDGSSPKAFRALF